MTSETCQSCGAQSLDIFYRADAIPVHSCRLVDSKEESLSLPKGDLRLGFCPQCGFIQNSAFDTALVDYSESYEDTQAFSGRFNSYVTEFADHLLDKYQLRGKNVLEIGCGRGDFLRLICERGSMKGVGFDPAYRAPAGGHSEQEAVRIYRDFYSQDTCEQHADLIVCRHTLEHIPAVKRFLDMVRHCVSEKASPIVCFEVPDTERILKEDAFWDVYYEHCSYFTVGSLERLFSAAGFAVLDIRKTYADQYIVIVATPVATGAGKAKTVGHLVELGADVQLFQRNVGDKLRYWRQALDGYRESGRRVALWGAGSKAAGFLTALNVTDEVGCVVDINPNKHGYYQAGTQQRIVAPQSLKEYQPDVVIIMNPIYREEIRKNLDAMGLAPELLAL
jgi:SAM-dependent methyltransferase